MHMLLERAASLFQAEGWQVKVAPTVLGDSGAIHAPDLVLRREGERDRAVFVLEALDGAQPLEARAHMAKDMACEPVFVVGDPAPEVVQWAERHRRRLVRGEDLGAPAPSAAPPAAREPAPTLEPGAIPEEALPSLAQAAPAPPPRAPRERPLSAFHAPPPAPAAPLEGDLRAPAAAPEPGDTGAELLPTIPRPDAPKPRRARPPPPPPDEVPRDGGVELLGSPRAMRPPPAPAPAAPPQAPSPAPHAAAGPPARAGPGAPGEEPDTGAEMLPSRPLAPVSGDRLAKHDPAIWDPRARLAQVKQAAKAGSFDATAVGGPTSGWLRNLRQP